MTEWKFSPSLGAAITLLVLFFATTITHFLQAIRYKHRYCCIIIISGLLQLLTYMFRIMSITIPDSFALYAAWFVLILIAPLWTNAFLYVLFGRMVMRYSYRNKLWCIKSSHFGLVFVILDVVALIVQVYGAASAAAVRDAPPDDVLRGLHIYMGGMAIQLLFILIFCAFAIGLFQQIHSNKSFGSMGRRDCMLLLCAQSVALGMIVIRIIFRLVEYSHGLDSSIPRHEVFQYCLDTLPMLIALVVFNVIHPGRVMRRKADILPSF